MKSLLLMCLLGICLSCSDAASAVDFDLFGQYELDRHQPPIVLVHGLGGSRLENADGRELWPAGVFSLLWGDYWGIALAPDSTSLKPKHDNLKIAGVMDGLYGRDFYGRLRQVLEEVGGYHFAAPGRPVLDHPSYYVFGYDWRQGSVVTARRFHEFLEQIRRDRNQPDLKVDVIAHSVAGLMVRYFALYGSEDVLEKDQLPGPTDAGADYLKHVAFFGAPIQGSVFALEDMTRGAPIGERNEMPPEVLATFPVSFQMLPHPSQSWAVTSDGRLVSDSLFELETWRKYQMSIFAPETEARLLKLYSRRKDTGGNDKVTLEVIHRYFAYNLQRARQFLVAINMQTARPEIEYKVFGSSCVPTPHMMVIEEFEGRFRLRRPPNEIASPLSGVDYESLTMSPGDGAAPEFSLFPLTLAVERDKSRNEGAFEATFVCEQHQKLVSNAYFQDKMLEFFTRK